MKLTPKYFRKDGITLIELLMTIIVVGIIAIPISALISQHFASVVQSSAHAITINLARFEMEKVNNLAYANISDLTTNYSEYNYDVVRTVTYAEGDAGTAESLKYITIEVRGAGSAALVYSLETYIAKNISYGI